MTSGLTLTTLTGAKLLQHIKLGERLTSFSGDSAQEWLNSIERRAQQLQGKTKRSNQEVTVTIPFNNGAELEAKFSNFSTQLIRKTLNCYKYSR